MRAPISILFLLLSFAGFAQVNLVPNGSFEEYTDCPDGQFAAGMLDASIGWYHPTSGTADFFHACANPDPFGTPINGIIPFDGDGMGHLLLKNGVEAREYAGIELSSTLESGQQYAFHMEMKLFGTSSNSTGSIGAYFSADSATNYSLDHDLYPLPAQLQRNPDLLMWDHTIWYSWQDTLVATGSESFLIVGNFLSNDQTPDSMLSGTSTSNYFIDNISLVLIEDTLTSTQEMQLPMLQLTNNAVRDELRFSVSGKSQPESVFIYSLNGSLLEQGPYNGANSIDVSHLPAGMYMISVTNKNGLVARERFVKL